LVTGDDRLLPLSISALPENTDTNLYLSKVSNHLPTLDDPLTWGILPSHTYLRSHLAQWTPDASDIVSINSYTSSQGEKCAS
ncbi:hypothetical protein BJY52DRAFT_1210405, partial [Lactarius psammicola]